MFIRLATGHTGRHSGMHIILILYLEEFLPVNFVSQSPHALASSH